MYTDDVRAASLNVTHHNRPLAQETSGGKLGTLASYKYARAILPNFETLDPRVAGQRAACDISSKPPSAHPSCKQWRAGNGGSLTWAAVRFELGISYFPLDK